jgi:hypothetical protein
MSASLFMSQHSAAELAVDAPRATANVLSLSETSSASAAPAKKKKRAIRIEHKVPGRIRMKIPGAKSNPEFLELFASVFSAIPGVTKIKSKPDTGNIVIHYDPQHESEFQRNFHRCCAQQEVAVQTTLPGDEIGEMAKKIEAEAEFLAERSQAVRATVDLFKNLDYQIKAATGNTVDLKIVLVGGLAAATFIEIGAEAATPMWVTLSLFAMNHFLELKQESRPVTASAASR